MCVGILQCDGLSAHPVCINRLMLNRLLSHHDPSDDKAVTEECIIINLFIKLEGLSAKLRTPSNVICRHRAQHLLPAFLKVQMSLMNIAAACK